MGSPTASTPGPGCRRSTTRPGCSDAYTRTSRSSGRCWRGAETTSKLSSPSSPTTGSRTRTRAREGMTEIVRQTRKRSGTAYVFVNNRLEGHAPTTIEAVAEQISVGSSPPDGSPHRRRDRATQGARLKCPVAPRPAACQTGVARPPDVAGVSGRAGRGRHIIGMPTIIEPRQPGNQQPRQPRRITLRHRWSDLKGSGDPHGPESGTDENLAVTTADHHGRGLRRDDRTLRQGVGPRLLRSLGRGRAHGFGGLPAAQRFCDPDPLDAT